MAFCGGLALLSSLAGTENRKQAKCIPPMDGAVPAKPGSEAAFALPPHMPFYSYYFPLLLVYESILLLD